MLADLAPQTIGSRAALSDTGFVRLDRLVTQEWLASARDDVSRFIASNGQGDHELTDPRMAMCPAIHALADDPRLTHFLDLLFRHDRLPGAVGRRTGRVLRILDGTGGVHGRPYVWHYDSCAITLVVPIVVPDDGSGELALFADSRPHRRSSTVSALEKFFVQNSWYGRILRRRFDSNPSTHTFRLEAGNAYVFRGYRTLHGTLPWPPGKLRVTLVVHYGEPHGTENWFVRFGRTVLGTALRQRQANAAGSYVGRAT